MVKKKTINSQKKNSFILVFHKCNVGGFHRILSVGWRIISLYFWFYHWIEETMLSQVSEWLCSNIELSYSCHMLANHLVIWIPLIYLAIGTTFIFFLAWRKIIGQMDIVGIKYKIIYKCSFLLDQINGLFPFVYFNQTWRVREVLFTIS